MTYALSHIGEAELAVAQPTAVEQQQPAQPVAQPQYTYQAAQIMALTALPWVPVFGLAWLGDRYVGRRGKAIGAVTGFAISALVIRSMLRGFAGLGLSGKII